MRKTILTLVLPAFLVASASLSAQQNYYTVKFPDDRTILSCNGTADTIWPVITDLGNCSFDVGIAVTDQVFNLNNTGGCQKILRTWKLLWWCDYNPNWPSPTFITNPADSDTGPTVTANSFNHGYLQYTQVIKIVDNVPPTYVDCPAGPVLFCDNTNNDPAQFGTRCEGPVDLKMKVTDACSKSDLTITYRLFLDLDGNGSMETFRSSSAPGAWPIEKTIIADTLAAKIVLPTGVGLPYGKHKVEWITNDRCGNESLCKYEFEVRDCYAPTVVCMNGLSINIMPSGMISLTDLNFLQHTYDNCTPVADIKIGICKAGTCTDFPLDIHSVTFDCNEVGQQFVEIWAEDAYGNADFCTTYVIVQDNFGACVPAGPVSGNITTDQNQPLIGAKVLLQSNLPAIPDQSTAFTDAQGAFMFAGAPGTCNYSLIPSHDTLPASGVSTLDAMLTEMHFSGQLPLSNPYRIIAADANRDGQLNQADLDAIGELVVGNANHFPGNTSWRFVPSDHVFPDPSQPLSGGFPETISTVCPAPSGLNRLFTAIKTGDVDGSVDVSSKGENEQIVTFSTPRKRFRAGDVLEVAIQTPELSALAGFQFTLEANPEVLVLESVEPGTLAPRIGVSLDQNRVAASWYSLEEMEGKQTVLILTFKALKKGSLIHNLHMSSSVAEAKAYNKALEGATALLQFEEAGYRTEETEEKDASLEVLLFPVVPNPGPGPVAASFFLPEAGSATLTLSDLHGRAVATQTAYFEKGYHRVDLPVETSGLFFLNLQTATETLVQRVVVQQ